MSLRPYTATLLLLFFFSCSTPFKQEIVKISGNAQGTTYNITYLDSRTDYSKQIDSLLEAIDLSLSTYVPHSVISRINNGDTTVHIDHHFKKVFGRSMEIATKTNGLFDPTVAPIVNAYGFGFTKKSEITPRLIDSLRQYTGYKLISLNDKKVVKQKEGVQLDFNAIAQGYTVDVLAEFIEEKGIENYLAELGGEVRCKGKNAKGEVWKIGIDKPVENPEGRPLEAVVELNDKSLATSGNYRKFYEEGGQKYAHTIDPRTGHPVKHNLLSATVVAPDCMTADAYATAFMVMGKDSALAFLKRGTGEKLEVFLIFSDSTGAMQHYATPGLPVKEVRD